MNDYGLINDVQTGYDKTYQKHTQVFQATHNGEGFYLPHMNRSFISFSFDGKNIEDFNLIATINGDRLQRKGYSEFEDLTSNYTVMDGHFYWGTHYTNHELDFELATDAMTQNELDSFLRWFSAGKVRELILSEHPNRAVQARVKATPDLHLLPFEEKTIKKIAGQTYHTSTTLYKGEISLSFVMEEPYWYSKINIFGYLDSVTGEYHDVWVDTNGIRKSIFEDPDAIKIALEDNIPIAGMIQNSMLLGDNNYADADVANGAQTAELEQYDEVQIGSGDNVVVEIDDEGQLEYLVDQARIAQTEIVNGQEVWMWGARIAGTIMSESSGIESFPVNTNQYFYYAGNAPSKPIIEFTLTPIINSDGYISNPKNSYTNSSMPYNIFSFESLNKKELHFTTPSVYTGYNQVIKIFKDMATTAAWVDVRKLIRDYVNHPAPRAWANKVIDSFEGDTVSDNKNDAIIRMKYFLQEKNSEDLLDATFNIDSKTGRAIGTIGYRIPTNITPTSDAWANYGTINSLEEDVGDMIRSNYLLIEDQNQPTDDGHIVAWANTNETTRLHSHIIKHDVDNGLKNVKIIYNNMYL